MNIGCHRGIAKKAIPYRFQLQLFMCVGCYLQRDSNIFLHFSKRASGKTRPPRVSGGLRHRSKQTAFMGGGLGDHTVPRGLCMQILFTACYVTAFHITRWSVIGVIRKYDGH